MNSRSKTLRNTFFSSVGMYTEYGLGMLTSIIIARHLGPEGFGAYAAVIWLVGMGVAATNAGTASSAIKFVAELRGADDHAQVPPLVGYLRRAQFGYLLVVVVAGAALVLIAGHRIAPAFDHAWLLVFLAAAVILRSAYMFDISVAKGFEDFRANAIVSLVATPLNLGLVIAVVWFDGPVEWLLASFLLSSVAFYVAARRQVRPRLPAVRPVGRMTPGLHSRVRRQMLYSTLIVTVGFIVASEVEVMFLTYYGHAHGAGQFKVAYQLAVGAVLLVPGVFGALLLPMMANSIGRGAAAAGERFAAATSYLALLAAPLVAFSAVLGGSLIQLLYGTEYAAAGDIFGICIAGVALGTLTQGGSSFLISADRQGAVLVFVLATGLLKLVLDAVLIRYYALDGAVMAFVVVCVASAASLMALAIRASGYSPQWGRLARTAVAALLSALAVLPLRGHLPLLVEIAVGGAALLLVYMPLTLLLGCWTRGDIAFLQQWHARLGRGRWKMGGRFLDWAYQRADAGATR